MARRLRILYSVVSLCVFSVFCILVWYSRDLVLTEKWALYVVLSLTAMLIVVQLLILYKIFFPYGFCLSQLSSAICVSTVKDFLCGEVVLFDLLIKSIPQPICIKNKNLNYSRYNRSYASFFKIPESLDTKMNDYDLLDAKLADNIRKGDIQVIKSKRPVIETLSLINGDGEVRTVEIQKTPVFNKVGEFEMMICFFLDKTEDERTRQIVERYQHQLEIEVKERVEELSLLNDRLKLEVSNRKTAQEKMVVFKSMVDSANYGQVLCDFDGAIIYANEKFYEMHGYDSAECDADNIEFFSHQDTSFVKKMLSRVRNEKNVYINEMSHKCKDGSVLTVLAHTSVIYDKNEPRYVAATFVDLSERKKKEDERIRLEKDLQQALRLESIGMLAAGIAHEINTPVQFIGDNLNFLSEAVKSLLNLIVVYRSIIPSCEPGPRTQKAIQIGHDGEKNADLDFLEAEIPAAISQTQDGLHRVTKIVGAMKDFSHIDEEDFSPSDINKSIESTVTVCRNEWKYVANMRLELDKNMPPVHCVAADINQVVMNLVINASHSIADVIKKNVTEGKGLITVSSTLSGSYALITVSDTGAGIPSSIRSKIFDPFFTTKPVGRGSGQGLALAYSLIVEKHKGKIYFDSEEGKGTTFFIEVPIYAPEKPVGRDDGK